MSTLAGSLGAADFLQTLKDTCGQPPVYLASIHIREVHATVFEEDCQVMVHIQLR